MRPRVEFHMNSLPRLINVNETDVPTEVGGRVLTEALRVAVPAARDKDCIVYYNTEQELHKRK
jgi:hypothetical protein